MAERWRDVCGMRIAPAELRFSDTVPGSRYRATLTVQNLRAGTCHLRLLPPQEPQFKLIVENPEKPIASGLQVKAVVEYTPKCAEDLQDKLTLLVDDDVVHIPLLGLIPYCDLEVESEVNFGEMIANNKLVTKEISIANRGTTSGAFRISYNGIVLLNIKPARGVVKPKSVRKIKVDICTDVPGVIEEMMTVELESRGCTKVWIKGVVVEQVLKVLGVSCGKVLKCVNFGPLYFGTSKTEKVHLYNESPECMDWVAVLEDNAIGGEMGTDLQGSTDAVLHDLSLKNKDVDVSTLILCVPNQGTLQPYEKSVITLCFSPEKFERDFEVSDASLIQDYVLFLRFETVGKRDGCLQNLSIGATATTRNHSRHVDLALMGSGYPVIITFNPGTVIKFKDCYLGEQAQVVCTMKNESEFLPVTFSFRKTAHFNISPKRGKLKKKSEKEVMISFSPRQIGTFEMKQIVDIIGTGVDKNNVDVLKRKSFHQIYLTLLGVCKSKRSSIVFTINPGLTPLISNATGQFVVRGTGQLSDTTPVAVLKSTQTQIHIHRKNRNCKDDALIAFPNDRAASLRPSERNKKYRTIFTKTERYNYVDPEFAYTDSERLLREENRKHYIDFISSLRERRLEKEAARQFYIYNNSVSIGIQPAEGLKSPNISITDFPREQKKSRIPSLDDNCMLTSRKLAAIVSKSTNKGVWSWLSPMPSSPQEKEDCSLTLTHKQLHQIFIGPSTIDFGDVCVYSTTTKELHIINNLSVHIWIQIEIEVAELQETSPLSQVVPPLTKTHIPVVFETATVGMFKTSFSYKINKQHTGHVLVVAHAMPIELQLSTGELILSPVPGCLAGTEFRRTVRVCNPRNHPAAFSWRPVTGDRKSTFSIKPIRGFVEAYSDVECEVVWHPGFNTPETGQFTLCVHKGNSINLKCFAKVPDNDEQFVPDFHSENLAFHSPPAKIKKEPQSPSEPTCSHEQPFQHNIEQCLYASAYDQPRQSPSPGVLIQPPLQQFPGQDRSFLTPAGPPRSTSSCGYLSENSSAYQPPVEMCHSFPPSQGMAQEDPIAYQCQLPKPCLQYPHQGFKQEHHDPQYEQANQAGSSQQYPGAVVVKQEQVDYMYDSDVPDCPSMYINAESYPSHSNTEDTLGCSYDKQMRSFTDDVCVVPEKFEAGDIKQEGGGYREGPPYQRRGSLQLWQFLVALLDNPTNSHFIAWTGRGMEFKLIEPEEVARLWGIQKNRPAMNYDKLSRSLRYYYEKGIMQKVAGERYVYKFVCEPEALFSMAFPEQQRPALRAELERQVSEEDTVPLSHLDDNGSYLPDLGSFPPQLYSKGYTY